MSVDNNGKETPEDFLRSVGKKLIENKAIDGDLGVILSKHLLTAAPAKDAVVQAKDEILKLAQARAALPKEEAANG